MTNVLQYQHRADNYKIEFNRDVKRKKEKKRKRGEGREGRERESVTHDEFIKECCLLSLLPIPTLTKLKA